MFFVALVWWLWAGAPASIGWGFALMISFLWTTQAMA